MQQVHAAGETRRGEEKLRDYVTEGRIIYRVNAFRVKTSKSATRPKGSASRTYLDNSNLVNFNFSSPAERRRRGSEVKFPAVYSKLAAAG